MKKSIITRIILWSVVALILIIILVLGINGNNFFGFNLGGDSYTNSELYSIGEGSLSPNQVSAINLNWVSGSIQVEEYEGTDINFFETSSRELSEKHKMRYYLDNNGRLIIQFQAPRSYFGFNNNYSKNLTVQVPKGFQMTGLDIDTVSSDLKLTNLQANTSTIDSVNGNIQIINLVSDKLRIDTVNGDITASGITVNTITVDGVSSDLEFTGNIAHISTSLVSGNTRITPGAAVSKIDCESVSGSITITIPESVGFTVKYDSLSERINSQFPTFNTSSNTLVYAGGQAQFDFETVGGSLNIIKE